MSISSGRQMDLRNAFAAARLANIELGDNVWSIDHTSISLPDAARALSVSPTDVGRARAILKYGTPEDEADILAGKISLAERCSELRPRRIQKLKRQKRPSPGRPQKNEVRVQS